MQGERLSLVSQCICEWSWYTGCDLWESHLRSYSSTPAPHLALSRPVSFSFSPQIRWDRWETYWNFTLPNLSCQTAEFCSDTMLASCLSFKTSMSFRRVPIPQREHAKLRLPSPPHSWMFSETLNYIHGTPEQTSACAPQWPYSNKIQFYPHADAGERLETRIDLRAQGSRTQNTFLNTLNPVSNLSFCLAQLLLDIVIGIFCFGCFASPKLEKQHSLTINPSCVPTTW